jgi:DNA mismatch repair protein MutS2
LIQTETLTLLEWPRLCQHLATFAATKLGVAGAQDLGLPATRAETTELLAQTQEVYALENQLNVTLQFDGIEDIRDSLARADVQGILGGTELLEVATTLAGARQLRRSVDDQEAETVPTLLALVEELRTYPAPTRNWSRIFTIASTIGVASPIGPIPNFSAFAKTNAAPATKSSVPCSGS